MMSEISKGRSIMSPGCSISVPPCIPAMLSLYALALRLLLSVRNPALVDQVRMDVLDVFLAQDVVETLHAGGREHPLQYDVLEGRMQAGVELAEVRRAARPQHMAARTLFDEFDLACVDRCLACGFDRGFRKGLFHARRRRRYRAAAQLEGNDAVGVLILESGAARRDGAHRNRGAPVSRLDGHELLAVDGVGHGCRHEMASGFDHLQHLSRI